MSGVARPSPAVVAKPLDVQWIHGSPSSKHNTDPDLQTYWYDENTVILRQNKAIDYEAPFLFLLFGNERAVLLDTGATASPDFFPLRRVVDGLIESWLGRNPHSEYRLLVLHTHAHGDHVAGDGQFADRADTVLVDADKDAAWAFFGFSTDAGEIKPVDLGGRVLQAFATPGHHAAAVTFLRSVDWNSADRGHRLPRQALHRGLGRVLKAASTGSSNSVRLIRSRMSSDVTSR